MLDTSDAAKKQQIKIVLSKTPQERAAMGVDMIDVAYGLVKRTIFEKYPNISRGELIAKIFQRYYKRDFTTLESEKIMHAIKNAHCLSNNQ